MSNIPLRTSQSHPILVPMLEAPGRGGGVSGDGRIGLTFCPGKHQAESMTGGWARDLRADLERLRVLGVDVLVSLIEDHEFRELGVTDLGVVAGELGLSWLHLPVPDMGVPGSEWEGRWRELGPGIHGRLDSGETVVVHCKGGLGRAGTLAARLLIERDVDAADAIARIRELRPGAIETREQEAQLYAIAARIEEQGGGAA